MLKSMNTTRKKWNISDASISRVEAQIRQACVGDESYIWRTLPGDIVENAISGENFAQPNNAREEIVARWIQDGDDFFRGIAARYFRFIHYENNRRRDQQHRWRDTFAEIMGD